MAITVKKTMGDLISNLPDAILKHILSLLPMKWAVRTAVLSIRWRYLWTSIRDLDFSERFGIDRKPEEIAAIVGRFLRLHSGEKVGKFQLCFYPGENHSREAEKWIEFVTARGVEELDLDFSHGFFYYTRQRDNDWKEPFKLPSYVWNCRSLKVLKLTLCDWYPPSFNAFRSLKTLYLTQVNITQGMLDILLSNCLILEKLTLRNIAFLEDLKISAQNLPLKSLTVIDSLPHYCVMDIFAPSLTSFHYYGNLINYSFRNISSLVDVVVDIRDDDKWKWYHGVDFERIQSSLGNIEILSVCDGFLWALTTWEGHFGLRIHPYHNLKELQLLMEYMDEKSLAGIYSFFRNCPCSLLERFFIEFPIFHFPLPYDCLDAQMQEPLDCAFDQLKTIKMTNFSGLKAQMRLLKFLLDKATALESLILIKPERIYSRTFSEEALEESAKKPVKELYEQVLLLSRTSLTAKILIYEQDTSCLWPTHSEIYPPYRSDVRPIDD